MNDMSKILVGKIVAPQGIRGEVRVQTYSESPMDFKHFDIQSSKFKSSEFHFVRRLNPTSDVIIARIDGIADRNAAETLRGTELFISRDALPKLGADEYDENIGRVACFQNYGAGDIIELENGDMVSFIGAYVDLNTRVIVVK